MLFRSTGDSDVVVFNGDVISSHNLAAQLELHRMRNADVTLHLTTVDDARSYGSVPTDAEGRVKAFLEKMDNPPTNNINAGCYIFKNSIIENIPKNQVVSVEREIFPDLISNGGKLFGYVDGSYWLDIGTPRALLQGSRDLVQGITNSAALDRYKFVHRDQNYLSLSESISGDISGGSAIGGFCRLINCTIEGSIISDGRSEEHTSELQSH